MTRILVVDDDDITRQFIVTALEWRGYEVLAASEGAEALDVYGEHGADLVICDVFMPGLNGLKTIERLASLPNPPRIILMSGARDKDATLQGAALRYQYATTLDKPFDLETLVNAVAESLGNN